MSESTGVREYLSGNAALLQAVGLQPHCELHLEPLGKGEHNENYLFGEEGAEARFVLRINRVPQPFHNTQVAYEYAALQALEQSGCTPRPLYCDASPQALGKGVLVESFCAGSELDFDNLRPGDLQNVARLMANVHAVPVQENCPLFCPEDPLRALFKECVDRFSVYKGTAFEDARYTRWIERFLTATQNAIDACAPPQGARHIINTETLPSHFLLLGEREGEAEGEAPRVQAVPAAQVASAAQAAPAAQAAFAAQAASVTPAPATAASGAFVDWERPILGEVAQDLAFFVAPSTTFWDSNYLFPHEDIQAFLDLYWQAVDKRFEKGSFEARFDAYLAVSVLRSQTWFCKNAARYAPTSNMQNAHTVQRTFDKWDIYTSDEFNEMLMRECF